MHIYNYNFANMICDKQPDCPEQRSCGQKTTTYNDNTRKLLIGGIEIL